MHLTTTHLIAQGRLIEPKSFHAPFPAMAQYLGVIVKDANRVC